MADLTQMFGYYLMDLFDGTAEIKDAGSGIMTVVYSLKQEIGGRRYSRTITIAFEADVVSEFRAATEADNVPRQDRIGDAVCESVQRRLAEYDENGPRDTSFQIYIDEAAAGL